MKDDEDESEYEYEETCTININIFHMVLFEPLLSKCDFLITMKTN